MFSLESQRSMAGISGQDNDESNATTLQNGSPKSQSVTATVNGNGKSEFSCDRLCRRRWKTKFSLFMQKMSLFYLNYPWKV